MANRERTGWRDGWISDWHRKWGAALALTDIDGLCWTVIEYSVERRPQQTVLVSAIVEYQEASGPLKHAEDVQMQALINLASAALVPLFYVRYRRGSRPWFEVRPMNRKAEEWIGDECVVMAESKYIDLLYQMRNLPPPPNLVEWLVETRRDR